MILQILRLFSNIYCVGRRIQIVQNCFGNISENIAAKIEYTVIHGFGKKGVEEAKLARLVESLETARSCFSSSNVQFKYLTHRPIFTQIYTVLAKVVDRYIVVYRLFVKYDRNRKYRFGAVMFIHAVKH